MDNVVAFGAPSDIVGVAKGVDLEGADIRGEEGKILACGGEHMPWIKIKEGHEEIEADCRARGDDKVGEDVVAEG